MTSPGPRSGGPTSRRSFTAAQKLDHLAAYEAALARGQGGAYLRSHGLYSSLISEWCRVRDAGVLAGKKPGEKLGIDSIYANWVYNRGNCMAYRFAVTGWLNPMSWAPYEVKRGQYNCA